MEVPTIFCSRCQSGLPAAVFNTAAMTYCPACTSELRVIAFPALLKPVEVGRPGELILIDGDAGCFYHPEKKAVLPCDSCGRFLCSLCDVDMNGEHLCPPCIETGKKKGKLKSLENHRVRYDDVALALNVLPVFFCLSWITAPIALYIAIRYWNAPGSILPRTKLRFVLAIVISVFQIIASVFLLFYLIRRGWN